jgi:hypothetical protein
MKILNVHEREISASVSELGSLLSTLGSEKDRVWPHETWPRIQLDGPLKVGTPGSHGKIRYFISDYEVGEKIELRFQFTEPKGFKGHHRFEIESLSAEKTRFRHVVEIEITGFILLFWFVVIRPLHDAVVEDGMSKVERELGLDAKTNRWGGWVELMRYVRGVRPAAQLFE